MKVAIYDEQQIAETPLPGVRVSENYSPNDFGAGVAQGVDKLAAGLEEAKARADTTNVMAGLASLKNGVVDSLDSSQVDPATGQPKGFKWKQGRDAVAASTSTVEGLAKLRDNIAQSLPNDEQKRLFAMHSSDVLLDAKRQIDTHTAEQIKVAQAQDFHALEGATLASVASKASSGDVASVLQEIDGLDAPLQIDATHQGQSVQVAQERSRQWKAQATGAALNAMLADKSPHSLANAQQLLAIAQPWMGEAAAQYEHHIATIRDEQQDSVAAFHYANDAIAARDTNGAPLQVDEPKAFAALDKDFADGKMDPDRWKARRALVQERIKDVSASAKQVVDGYASQALQQFMAPGANGQPRLALAAVSPDVKAWLTDPAHGKGAADAWQELVKWDESQDLHNRTLRNTPTDAEAARAFRIERSMAVNPGAWRGLAPGDQQRVMAGSLAVPGDPDAPAVAISARDVPTLSKKIADISAAIKPKYATPIEKIAHEEAAAAFPDLANAPAQSRDAVKDLGDRLTTFVDAEVNRSGKEPTQVETRKEAVRLMQDVQLRERVWGFLWHKTAPRLDAEKLGQPFDEIASPAGSRVKVMWKGTLREIDASRLDEAVQAGATEVK